MARISASFELLDERVRRWVWRQGWTSLKDIQENAIPFVLDGNKDVIISASTAGGKTEAAFLPILTSILQRKKSYGYKVLYVSPLKALINDQYRRLSDMTSEMGIEVIPWHGDISASRKDRSLKRPDGIVIITPESLESFLINRGQSVKYVFSSLQYVVIDELHSFIGSERGKQLQSLLSRIEHIIHRHIPRIAMSATFSDYHTVKNFLRNDGAIECSIPLQGESNHEIRILVKEYIPSKDTDITTLISNEIYNKLRGTNNLVFTNSRAEAEEFAVHLTDICEKNSVPNEFRIHHGSLSKIVRESVEHDLQKGEQPITAICTSTMELGVDIGKVKSIVQIGVATSVSGLRQRLGRSGRRDEPSLLRVFSTERRDEGLLYDLRNGLVQNIAIIELMRKQKYETPSLTCYHFSTLIQQILAVIAQFGGFYPKEGWALLCQNGAFKNVTPNLFLELLSSIGKKDVISQLNTGQIVIGKLGEKILKAPDFYVAFVTPVDLTVINRINSKRIGMIQHVPRIGDVIILSGIRWIVDSFDESSSKVYVSFIKSGGKARFGGDKVDIDRIIIEKMRDIYLSDTIFPYLDENTGASEHLQQARNFFKHNNLIKSSFLKYGNEDIFLNWAGTKVNRTISLLAQYCLNKQCDYDGFFVSNMTLKDIELLRLTQKPDLVELASMLPRPLKTIQKYDFLLSDRLLNLEYSCTYLDSDVIRELS